MRYRCSHNQFISLQQPSLLKFTPAVREEDYWVTWDSNVLQYRLRPAANYAWAVLPQNSSYKHSSLRLVGEYLQDEDIADSPGRGWRVQLRGFFQGSRNFISNGTFMTVVTLPVKLFVFLLIIKQSSTHEKHVFHRLHPMHINCRAALPIISTFPALFSIF